MAALIAMRDFFVRRRPFFALSLALGAACSSSEGSEPPRASDGGSLGAAGAPGGGHATNGAGLGGANMAGMATAGLSGLGAATSSGGAGASNSGGANAAGGSLGGALGGTAGSAGASAGLVLSAIAANGTVGLEWNRSTGATSYKVYWAATPGVNPATGQMLETTESALVHRGLNNGTEYHYVVVPVSAGVEGAISNEVSATPTGEWVLEQLGSGDFEDVVTDGRVPRIPLAQRIHVLLLPEGYLASELPGFHDHATHDLSAPTNDVDRWLREVFAIEPYSIFREAFVIWYLPRASMSHVGAGANTAFGIQMSGNGVGTVSGAAAPLWSALDGEGSDAFAFPPGQPVLNHVAAFLILDASRNPPRAGYSGLSTSLTNPGTNQRIRAGFAQGHAHELTHAFAAVADEYLENDNTITSTSQTSNVVATNRCAELPWAHLLLGGGFNTADQLVGAFGRPQRGYHSELLCLMNGTHDNGEHFCGDPSVSLTLRPNDRMCNWCRELTSYRIFEKTGVLSGSSSFESWKTSYRSAFYQRFGFKVPAALPQGFRCGQTEQSLFEPCVP